MLDEGLLVCLTAPDPISTSNYPDYPLLGQKRASDFA